ncbi:riboflavin synthase [Pseudobutyrivibrio sp.]|uniref:riboflavin synthase n=1 Tax=Pseudobutyrivibrio sp. TaxID=2014367 RepID=UPI001B2818EE|nr:riboflavin synthase [Pseudobutyrivibrio sp.]MBO5617628.1 riboflavin synthase [Pseudobutyrivibrio sp.]MBP3260968.1 riboflavin synthase [Pseudobutyrivibrio sp.]
MFTGIVEEMGTVTKLIRDGKQQRISINCHKILEDIHIGDSIAVNGVCLTVVTYGGKSFQADVMNETFMRSGLGALRPGSSVNLERAMAADGRFGGHIVSGHIDGTGTIKSIKKDDNAIWFEIVAPRDILDGIVEKGSIAIDGISLTIAAVDNVNFKVSIIPHTLKETVLGVKKVGDTVNLETDVIGKYVKKLLESKTTKAGLTKEMLLANGFY